MNHFVLYSTCCQVSALRPTGPLVLRKLHLFNSAFDHLIMPGRLIVRMLFTNLSEVDFQQE